MSGFDKYSLTEGGAIFGVPVTDQFMNRMIAQEIDWTEFVARKILGKLIDLEEN